jgi:Putative Flp pilus-assembly TadE/G-like
VLRRTGLEARRGERGQTIILVAVSIISLLAMAALAIDVVTLYVARTEIQRAADAAALAAAKAVADSGLTTLTSTSDPNYPGTWAVAQQMAAAAVTGVLVNNTVAGNQLLWSPPVGISYPPGGLVNNPQITITLQQANLPTFFARIWSGGAPTASATAVAEAYNPSNMQDFTPISPKCVKPWLVANVDPTSVPEVPFVTVATGQVEPDVIGKIFSLTPDCTTPPGSPTSGCVKFSNPPGATAPGAPTPKVGYLPASVTAPGVSNVCPSCAGWAGNGNPEEAIECCDQNTVYQCGGTVPNQTWDNSVNPGGSGGLTDSAVQCLIHDPPPGPGKDTLNYASPYIAPPQFVSGSGPQSGNRVTTSTSIVTVPIIDTTSAINTNAVTVVGFLQAFVNGYFYDPSTNYTDINITVLNIAGCSQTPNGASPVIGGSGTSPIPVRLVSP